MDASRETKLVASAETATPAKKRLVVAEDSVLLREGIVRLLEEVGYVVVGQAGDAPSLIALCRNTNPDVAIVDVRMPPTFTDDGLRAAIEVRRTQPNIGILVLSQYIEAEYARQLVADSRGGVGYLLKDRIQDIDALAEAVSQISSGGIVVDPQVIAQLVVRPESQAGIGSLTPRERQVLDLVAQGRSNAGIAKSLSLSIGAVEKNISQIFTKLDLYDQKDDHRRVLAVLSWLHR